MQITKEQNDAAGSIVEWIANEIGNNRQLHAGTAIAAGARLAGSFMFRSFNFNLNNVSPGAPVLSEEANEKGPVLINVLVVTLKNLGVEPDAGKMNTHSKVESSLTFVETILGLQDQAQSIMNQNNLNKEQMAYSCAIATASIIKECQNDLPVESGFHTAVYGFIEGSKTYPPELGTPKTKNKSIF
ncbi:MAG TPA: hypothetical protein VFP97_06380 [Chitinophagaceae bacterium]|nr:hypothetical protein [Chitinophagaceae bacterium]